MEDLINDLKGMLNRYTEELHAIVLKDDPETNLQRTKMIAKRELIIELLARYT